MKEILTAPSLLEGYEKISQSIEMPPHKLLIDTDVPEAGLKAIGALRELKKVLRIQKLCEFTVQQSILSYFTLVEN